MKIQRGYFFASSATQKATLIVSQPFRFDNMAPERITVFCFSMSDYDNMGGIRISYPGQNNGFFSIW